MYLNEYAWDYNDSSKSAHKYHPILRVCDSPHRDEEQLFMNNLSYKNNVKHHAE